jgi:hypothetical protein
MYKLKQCIAFVAPYAALASCTAAVIYWLKTAVLISSFVLYRRDNINNDLPVVTDSLEKSLDQSLLVGSSSALYTLLISLSAGIMIGLYAVDIAADDNSVSWSAALWLLIATLFNSSCFELVRRSQFNRPHYYIMIAMICLCNATADNPVLGEQKEIELKNI